MSLFYDCHTICVLCLYDVVVFVYESLTFVLRLSYDFVMCVYVFVMRLYDDSYTEANELRPTH